MKKILCTIVVSLLLISSIPVHAMTDDSFGQSAETAIMQIPNGIAYKRAIDSALASMTEQKANQVYTRLEIIKQDISGKTGSRYDQMHILIAYIQNELRNNFELANTVTLPMAPLGSITNSDKAFAESQILMLQSYVKKQLDALGVLIETEQTYRQRGDMSAQLHIDLDTLGTADGSLSLSDYDAKKDGLDEQLTGKIKAMLDVDIPGEEMIDSEFQAHSDVITKDGIIYFMLKDITLKDNNGGILESEVGPMIDVLNNLGSENTYISLGEIYDEDVIEMLELINPEFIQEISSQVLDTPLLEAYAKEGNTYFMQPTQKFCDFMKDEKNIFDPINGATCTDSQYESMLEEFQSSGVQVFMIDARSQTGSMILSIEDKSNLGEKASASVQWNGLALQNVSFIVTEAGFESKGNLDMDSRGEITNGKLTMTYPEEFDMYAIYSNKQFDMMLKAMDESGSNRVSCNAGGPLKKDYLDIDMHCDIFSTDLSEIGISGNNATIDANLSINTQSSNETFSFNLNAQSGSNALDININGNGQKTRLPSGDIQAPKKSVPLEDVLDEIYSYDY